MATPVWAEPVPESGPDTAAEGTGRITKNPTLIEDASPQFPALALESRMEAEVVLSLDIAANGSIDAVSVASVNITTEEGKAFAGDDEFGFGTAALVAGNQLSFSPAEVDGSPVPVTVSYTYRFTLPAKAAASIVPEASLLLGLEMPVPQADEAAPIANFEGTLVERGTRALVAAVTVTVFKGEGEGAIGFEATSDEEGRFSFFDLEPGTWNIIATRPGYIPYKTTETIVAGEGIAAKYYFERGSYNAYDVMVEAQPPRKEVTRRRLRSADIEKVPGTLGDPVLVVENLPGVARASAGEIIVRGSGPNDTGVFVDGTQIPLIYHFGALKSIFPAKVIDSIDFYPGNFSVAYGRAMGGILDLHLKKLDPDRFHGSIDVSVLDTSVYLEAPITDKLAVGVAGRRSYIDHVLEAVVPDDAGLGLVQAPKYYDYQFFGNYRPSAKHDLRWLLLGSDDYLEVLFDNPAEIAGGGATDSGVTAGTNLKRLTLEHRYTPNTQVKNRLKLSAGMDELNFAVFGFIGTNSDIHTLALRDTLSYAVSDNFKLDTGVDVRFENVNGTAAFPAFEREGNPTSGFDEDDVIDNAWDNQKQFDAAPFIEGELKLGGLTMVPGLRVDYFGLSDSWSADPRLSARYDGENWAIKGGTAVVHQDAFFADVDKNWGNPDVGLQRAFQYSVGAEWSPVPHIKADATLFYKDMQGLIGSSDRVITRDGEHVSEKLANNTSGRVYGAEAFVEHTFANNFRGWLSYTLSRAERNDPGADDYRLFDYDQTHILAMVGSYTLPQNWELGFRWRYVTGTLTTPVVGSVFNNDQNAYTPVYGEVNSARMPSFHQLDLRVDKTWVFDEWKLSGYLSVVNSYNRGNVEDVKYNFDYSKQAHVTGLPILPILGVKGEW